jgi:ABC-type proline/glycine betaine transport system permease subunit
VLGVAIPYFWLAILLVLLFAVKLRVLPALGTGSVDALILPAIALGWGFAAIIARLLRNNLIEVYQSPYMIVARAKGLSEWQMLWHHALRNAISSTVTIVGLQFGYLLAGAVAIEVIFGRPGLGAFLVARIQQKDVPSIQGVVLFVAVVYLFANLLVDVVHALLDPRIRRAGRGDRARCPPWPPRRGCPRREPSGRAAGRFAGGRRDPVGLVATRRAAALAARPPRCCRWPTRPRGRHRPAAPQRRAPARHRSAGPDVLSRTVSAPGTRWSPRC